MSGSTTKQTTNAQKDNFTPVYFNVAYVTNRLLWIQISHSKINNSITHIGYVYFQYRYVTRTFKLNIAESKLLTKWCTKRIIFIMPNGYCYKLSTFMQNQYLKTRITFRNFLFTTMNFGLCNFKLPKNQKYFR